MSKLHVFSLTVLFFVLCVHCSSAKLCDIKSWYKDLVDDNIIPKKPSEEQEKLKNYLEKKIANLRYSGSAKVDCDVLEDYKETLSKRNLKDLSRRPNKKKPSDTNVRKKTKVEYHDDDLEKKLKDMDNRNTKTTVKGTKKGKREGKESEEKEKVDVPDDDDFDPTESEIDETELLDEEVVSPEPPSQQSSKDNEKGKEEVNFNKMFENEFLKSKGSASSKGRGKRSTVLEEKDKSPKKVNSKVPGLKIEKIQEETLQEEGKQDIHESYLKSESTVNVVPRILSSCNMHNVCSAMCYYSYQNQQSLDHYPRFETKIHNVLEEEVEDDQNSNPTKVTDDSTPILSTSLDTNPESKEIDDLELKPVPGTQSDDPDRIKAEKKETVTDKKPITQDIENLEDIKQVKSIPDVDDKQLHDVHKDQIELNKEPIADMKAEPDHIEENNNKENIKPPSFSESESNMRREHFDLLFQKSASEYSAKIQQLEIFLMKLENQILSQKLHKQNDTNSYIKLEFQILKLENELLKLNQSYSKLHEDHETMKNQRGEIEDQLKQHNKGKYAALPEANTTQHTELINQQQIKISQLTDWLNNQSSILNRLRDKSDHLTEQNQILYQIVMNQTALISNIMQKMQDLSDQNLSHRKDTQDLKSKMEMQDASNKLIDRLESLATDRKLKPNEDMADFSTKPGLQSHPVKFTFLPDTPDVMINRHQWTCAGVQSTQTCYLFSVLLSPCPPFSTVYWRKCPKYILEKTAAYFAQFVADHPDGEVATKHKPSVLPSIENTMTLATAEDEGSKQEQTSPKLDSKNISEQEKPVDSVNGRESVVTKDLSADDLEKAGVKSKKEKEEKVSSRQEKHEDKDKTQQKQIDEQEKSKDTIKESEKENKIIEKKTDDKPQESAKTATQQEDEDKDGEEEGRPIIYKEAGTRRNPKDCYELFQRGSRRNGVYKIFLPGLKYYVNVFCDMKQGGWTVIQMRDGGRVDFYKNWQNYKDGFGSPLDEYYLGNDNIHFLTNQGHYTLNVELTNWKKEKRLATYKDFWIDEESEGYKLHLDGYGGDAGDGLSKHNGMKFSTFDVDNDKVVKQFGGSCAKRFHGAGWYYKCYASNLNGQFYRNGEVPSKKFDGIAWKPWTGPNYSLKTIVLKIRPKDVLDD